MSKALAQQHPDGPLFRTAIGTVWTASGIDAALKRLARRYVFAQRPIANGYRDSLATDAHANGIPDAHWAELVGPMAPAIVPKGTGQAGGGGVALTVV